MRSPKETYEKYISVSQAKIQLNPGKAFLLAVLAGMFIAFAGVASTFGNALVNRICGAVIFCGGLAMVLVAGSELFTGNCLLIMPLLDKKVKASGVLKNLIIVYIGNLIGALFVAVFAVYSGVLDGVYETAVNIAASKASLSFSQALFRGILCNILVCIAVWMSFSSDKTGDKILSVIFPVTFFVLCGFEHSIADMYYLPAGMLLKTLVKSEEFSDITITLYDFFIKNLLPVTTGNIIGGALVGSVYRVVYTKKTDK